MAEGIVNVGIVGYGMMGKHHAEVWSHMPGVKIAVVADPVRELREEAAEKYKCGTFDDIYDMIDCLPALDIVIVATHAPYHHAHTLTAIRYGCHVVCEKPMALTLEECDEMISSAKAAGVKLAVHHQSIFSRAFAEARRVIETRAIGNLHLLRAYGKGRIACSDLMEIAGHLVHGMRYLARAEVVQVYGDVSVNGRDVTYEDAKRVKDLYREGRDSGIGAGDRMFGFYKFANGARAELQLMTLSGAPTTFNEQRNFGYYIDIYGSAARLQLYLPRVLFYNQSPLDDRTRNDTPWEEPNPEFREDTDPVLTRYFAEDFLRSIREGRNPVVSGDDGRMAMEMTLGIYGSHFAGKPLTIPLAARRYPFKK